LQARYIFLAPAGAIAILTTKSALRSLSAQRLSERTVYPGLLNNVSVYLNLPWQKKI
jgi:hypothetical protein